MTLSNVSAFRGRSVICLTASPPRSHTTGFVHRRTGPLMDRRATVTTAASAWRYTLCLAGRLQQKSIPPPSPLGGGIVQAYAALAGIFSTPALSLGTCHMDIRRSSACCPGCWKVYVSCNRWQHFLCNARKKNTPLPRLAPTTWYGLLTTPTWTEVHYQVRRGSSRRAQPTSRVNRMRSRLSCRRAPMTSLSSGCNEAQPGRELMTLWNVGLCGAQETVRRALYSVHAVMFPLSSRHVTRQA